MTNVREILSLPVYGDLRVNQYSVKFSGLRNCIDFLFRSGGVFIDLSAVAVWWSCFDLDVAVCLSTGVANITLLDNVEFHFAGLIAAQSLSQSGGTNGLSGDVDKVTHRTAVISVRYNTKEWSSVEDFYKLLNLGSQKSNIKWEIIK
ncbi:MAG: hypothetical protein LBP59_10860 [Planctomycetaceae bacterium]|nr:hypothetical protein [Planctomycetaceae bacterium]